MKKYVYPSVIYYDEDSKVYVLAIQDLNIYAEGDSVEEAHARGEQFLGVYLEECFADNVAEDIPTPMNFEDVIKENPKQICVLIEATLDDKNKFINKSKK